MKYPKELIQFKYNDDVLLLSNIMRTVDFSELNQDYIQTIDSTSHTPMSLSLDLYGTSEYYWVLCLINNVINIDVDWYLSEDDVREYASLKYENVNYPNYFYYITTGEVVPEQLSDDLFYLYDNSLPLPNNVSLKTNYEYERELNEKKRSVKIIPKVFLLEFINYYNEGLKK